MRSTVRTEIFDLPRALRQPLEQGRREYDAVIRTTRWGERPKIFAGPAEMLPLAEYMAQAFRELLDWDCLVQPVAETGVRIRPASVYFLISGGSEFAALVPLAQAIRVANGRPLALVTNKADPLAQAVDGSFVVSQKEVPGSLSLGILRHAAAGYLALLTAHALKRPARRSERLEREYAELPGQLEQFLSHRGAGVKSLAAALARSKRLSIVAGGSYHCAAQSAAELLSRVAGIAAGVECISEGPCRPRVEDGSTVLVLNGSRSHMKAKTIAAARAAQRAGAEVLALTDGNDSGLARLATMTLRVPALDEITGSVMAHAIMAWVAFEASRLSLVARKPVR